MKKLIAIAVVFALVSGVAFAMDVSGHVFGTVDVLKGDSGKDSAGDANPVESGADLNRLRLDGSGEAGDGKFGGYFRVDGKHWSGNPQFFGNAWWKPIDQLKILIGSNGGDGFIGKEGNTGWMFYQTPTDVGVSMGGDNVWGGSLYGFGINTRSAFFEGGGDGDNALYLFVTPLDMLKINILLPFFSGGETGDVFKQTVVQLDLNLDFGNIALTYQGGLGYDKDKGRNESPGSVFLYFGGSFGDLSIDFGLGYHFALDDGETAQPIGVGLGVKYATDAFGVKFRTVANLGGDDKATKLLVDVLPYFSLGDNLTAFVSLGLGINAPDEGDANTGWHFNPYIQVGEEWGAKFLAGVKLWSDGVEQNGDPAIVHWAVPIALIVSF